VYKLGAILLPTHGLLMTVIGVRCSHKSVAFAVVSGTLAEPTLQECRSLPFPKAISWPQTLSWVYAETDALFKSYRPSLSVIKRFEGRSKGNTYEQRVECEGVVTLAASANAVKTVLKRPKSSIAKCLGVKGRAKYLQTLDTSSVSSFASQSEHEQDAILAAWSGLK
jgi:hypothetical protein